MSKETILKTTGVSLAVLAASLVAVTSVDAFRGGATEEERQERITEFAERFDLDESEVQSYFEEKKAERQAEREERRAEYLAGLVEDGTLTQEQADELTARGEAIKAEVTELKESGAEREEIKALMEENKAELEAWAESEGISLEDVRPDKGERRGHRG